MNEAKAKAIIEELNAEMEMVSRRFGSYSQSSMIDSARSDADADYCSGLAQEVDALEDAIESGDFSEFVVEAPAAPAPIYTSIDENEVPF